MDWAALLGAAALLGVIAMALFLLWRLLLGLLLFGPPTYCALVIGHFVGVGSGSAWLGFVSAILAMGVLSELLLAALSWLRRTS